MQTISKAHPTRHLVSPLHGSFDVRLQTKRAIKSLLSPRSIKQLRALRASANHRAITDIAQRESLVYLQPVGLVEHYFHFIFDLCIPLWKIIENSPRETVFVLNEFGFFTDQLQRLFPDRIRIESTNFTGQSLPSADLQGLNPRYVQLSKKDLIGFGNYITQTLAADTRGPRNKVLLIERMPPNDYFRKAAVHKGSGASRRSIPNHQQLADAIRSRLKAPFEFQNVQLEKLSLEEQIHQFKQAALVIGQHGAGLSNIVWMSGDARVFELSHDLELDHFKQLSTILGHGYSLHQTAGPHVEVDVDRVIRQLTTDASLRNIFS